MSFSSEVKEEILNINQPDNCCKLSGLCAVINSIGQLSISKNGYTFSIVADSIELIEKTKELINALYSSKISSIEIYTKSIGKTKIYETTMPSSVGADILKDAGILTLDSNNNFIINHGVDHHLILEDCCKKAYLQFIFLATGTVSIPENNDINSKSRGYHLEIELNNNEQAKIVASLLGEFGFIIRKVERNDKYVLYLKESDSIADLIAFLGAKNSYLKLQNEIVERDLKNNINRQSNCMSANIDKTLNASIKQLQAIDTIENTIGLNSLSADLQEIVLLRKNNPESSLIELMEIYKKPITKSGLSYKLNRLVEIAKNL